MPSDDFVTPPAVKKSSLHTIWRTAAEKIAAADFLLIATGAGFSADSSLPVYADIAKVDAYDKMGVEYHDLCDPYMLEQDEDVFYGFWGSCTNSYRDTKHHRGYEILLKWKDAVRTKGDADQNSNMAAKRAKFRAAFDQLKQCGALPSGVTIESVTNDPFFVYTSNVDSHWTRDFDTEEVYELHGSVETWQCAGDVETNAREPCKKTWMLPVDFRFDLDMTTMRAPGAGATTCPECGGKGRPNVLMFHDRQWIANTSEENGYIAWESVMELMLQEDPMLNLVVLEIGCGTRVPSVRRETEMVVADVIEGCGRPQATLIRVNPDNFSCTNPLIIANKRFLSIPSKGLEALESIDRELSNFQLKTCGVI
uniref:Deacetylase sirtuin-type domain-containing protein n=1 Tax=Peronospora matthiolae TaxID=2874970 RepID=A0AAV1UNG4_9STRA